MAESTERTIGRLVVQIEVLAKSFEKFDEEVKKKLEEIEDQITGLSKRIPESVAPEKKLAFWHMVVEKSGPAIPIVLMAIVGALVAKGCIDPEPIRHYQPPIPSVSNGK